MMSLSALLGAKPWAFACCSMSSRPRSPSVVIANTSSISNCSAAASCEVKSEATSFLSTYPTVRMLEAMLSTKHLN
jgi:hypothetical protein